MPRPAAPQGTAVCPDHQIPLASEFVPFDVSRFRAGECTTSARDAANA
jgi:hypothetical protein